MPKFQAAYIATHNKKLLAQKSLRAGKLLENCCMCPRRCGVNRRAGEIGFCQTGAQAEVASFDAHFGEESPLVGQRGSGTIFFSHCNLLCNFCQNYDISHEGYGQAVSPAQLADMMLHLQDKGCHNINFVTPSHVVPQILESLEIAIPKGLTVPLVYNSGGYDRVETLALLAGVFDIYMPDFKFWDPEVAQKTCAAEDYPAVARRALIEMHRQVGELVIDDSGLARRGLLVRHLVLPRKLAGTREVTGFIVQKVSARTYVNVMSQYRPCGRAAEIQELAVKPTAEEYRQAVETAKAQGLTRLDPPRRVFRIW